MRRRWGLLPAVVCKKGALFYGPIRFAVHAGDFYMYSLYSIFSIVEIHKDEISRVEFIGNLLMPIKVRFFFCSKVIHLVHRIK